NSYGVNRFTVSFEAPTTLPVNYTSFTATTTNEGVMLNWSTLAETNNNRFEVQRAGDDKIYEKLHTVLAKGSGTSYSYIDKGPIFGNNYYKIVQIDNDNSETETLPQVVNYTGNINGVMDVISAFPNPVISGFTLKYNGPLKD